MGSGNDLNNPASHHDHSYGQDIVALRENTPGWNPLLFDYGIKSCRIRRFPDISNQNG